MHNRVKVSAVRYALRQMPTIERNHLVQSVLEKTEKEIDDIAFYRDELLNIKNVGETTAREILFAVGLVVIEADFE